MDFKRLRQGAINTWTVPLPAQIERRFFRAGRRKWPKDPQTGAVFPSGIIPKTRFSPNSYRLLQNYPAPNFTGSGGNFVFPTVSPLTTNQYILKGDYNVNSKNQISVHWLHDYYLVAAEPDQPGHLRAAHPRHQRARRTGPTSPTPPPSIRCSSPSPATSSRRRWGSAQPDLRHGFQRKGEGINYPLIYNAADFIPSISVSGYNGLSVTPLNFDNFNRIFQGKDDFSKLIGNHNVKAGILSCAAARTRTTSRPSTAVSLQHLSREHHHQCARRCGTRQLLHLHRGRQFPPGLVPLHAGRAVCPGRLEGQPPADREPRACGGPTCSRSTAR